MTGMGGCLNSERDGPTVRMSTLNSGEDRGPGYPFMTYMGASTLLSPELHFFLPFDASFFLAVSLGHSPQYLTGFIIVCRTSRFIVYMPDIDVLRLCVSLRHSLRCLSGSIALCRISRFIVYMPDIDVRRPSVLTVYERSSSLALTSPNFATFVLFLFCSLSAGGKPYGSAGFEQKRGT